MTRLISRAGSGEMTVLYDAVGVDDRSNSVQFVRRRLRSASGFSRGRISGVSVCADRLRSRRVRCPDSLCHSWHTKNKSGDCARIYRGAALRANITVRILPVV